MSFYKNINIIRAISDLKNGLPVCINFNKHSLPEEASKMFYFAKGFIHPHIEKLLINPVFISTIEKKEHGRENYNIILPQNNREEEFLKLLKICELTPVLIRVSNIPLEIAHIETREIELEEVKNFIEDFLYNVKLVANSKLSLKNAEKSEFFVFRSLFINTEHYTIKIGNPDAIPLIRIHSSCYTGDLLASLRCDCRDQLQESIKFISQNGGGYILYIMQEGRGIGLSNKIEAYKLQQENNMDTVESNLALGFLPDERQFIPAVKMLSYFNIKKVRLITNNPKKGEDLIKLGIKIEETVNTYHEPNPHNMHYLEIKRRKMKHTYNNKN